jgi:hypothetical protein
MKKAPLVAGRGLLDTSLLSSSDQRARISGSPEGFFVLMVRLVIVISMESTLP